MSIQPLPTSTVQQLRCSMNLTSPCDFIKELIDNAVDANATAIEITVSSNTLDRIAVKDNGTGIDIDDFTSLGRRAHTSKLRAFEELASIGGKSLGFRGEALASANALANIVIITKKSRDPIAWRIELAHGVGGVQAKRPVSATVGTTVAATQLFENMLPRQKSLLKEKSKTMSKIQGILKAYALARPHIKWSLKVVGDSKPVWSYSPASGASGREAILQLFGANLMERCIEISERRPESPVPDTEGHSIKSTGDWIFSGHFGLQPSTSTSRQGVFISIDGRPMSSSWHISKKILNIFKSHVMNIKESSNIPSMSTTHLFVQLSIHCPPMTYDPNIAARKDEVLLADEKSFLGKLEAVFRKSVVQKMQCQSPNSLLSKCKTSGVTPQCEESRKCQSAEETDNGEAEISRQTNDNDKNKNHIASHHNSIDQEKQEHHHSKEPSASSRLTVRAVVNTSFTVNMSIKEDAESPNGTSLDTIEVEIPRRPSPVQVDDPVRKDHIRHYFHPVPNQDFEIACDDTATTAQTKEPKDMRQSLNSHPPKRVPLQPLTASDLNRMREEDIDYDLEQVESGDPRLVRTAMNAESAIISPPSQTANDGTRPLRRPGESGIRFQPPPVPFQRAQDSREAAINAPFIGHSPMVLTPPPSDPRYRDDGGSPLLRPRLRLFDASPTPANIADRSEYRRATLAVVADAHSPGGRSEELRSRDTDSAGHQGRFAVPWLRSEGSSISSRGGRRREDVTRAREPSHEESEGRGRGSGSQQDQFVVPWLRSESSGKSSRGGRSSQGVTHTLANKDYPTLLGRPVDKRPRGKQPLVPLRSSPFAEALEESPMTKKATPPPPEFGGGPQIYSHASQIALARTPAPLQRFGAAASGVMNRQAEDVEFRSPSTDRQMTDEAEWLDLRKPDGSRPSQAGFCERISAVRRGTFDPEPTDRQFVQSEGELSTQRLVTTISTGHEDIERLSSQHAKVGQYELPGDIVVSLLGANLGSVQSVQRRLRWCVDSWMQQNKMQGQVDYEM
ncbi:hypothetical protein E4U48_001602 [Claviceps purpurea]|nr:hypothetical protein E4U48_001602 [Claviceps purpurea]